MCWSLFKPSPLSFSQVSLAYFVYLFICHSFSSKYPFFLYSVLCFPHPRVSESLTFSLAYTSPQLTAVSSPLHTEDNLDTLFISLPQAHYSVPFSEHPHPLYPSLSTPKPHVLVMVVVLVCHLDTLSRVRREAATIENVLQSDGPVKCLRSVFLIND